MSKVFGALCCLLVLASCGSRPTSTGVPRGLDNACEILNERPKYARAFKAAERRWGIPVHVQMATIHQESRFKGDARTPFRYTLGVIPMGRQSSAFGYAQALDATWEEYKKATGKHRARRDSINDATDFMGWYMDQTQERVGVPKWDARNQYLAYHEGRTGFSRGTHNGKSWLLAVADKVDSRAQMYNTQLQMCRP